MCGIYRQPIGTDREEEPVPSGGTYATERVSWMVMQEEGEVPVVL